MYFSSIYIYIGIAHVLLVYVGLAQARPNYNSTDLVAVFQGGLAPVAPRPCKCKWPLFSERVTFFHMCRIYIALYYNYNKCKLKLIKEHKIKRRLIRVGIRHWYMSHLRTAMFHCIQTMICTVKVPRQRLCNVPY